MTMLSRAFPSLTRRLVNKTVRFLHVKDNECNYFHTFNTYRSNILCKQYPIELSMLKRYKSKKKQERRQQVEDDSDEEETVEDEEEVTPGSKVLTTTVSSMRLDVITKAGLKTARNKVEKAFYGGRIRLNGDKILQKSVEVAIDDEIDVIQRRSTENSDFLIISRVKVISADSVNIGYKVKLAVDKSLLIEDYEDPWKESS